MYRSCFWDRYQGRASQLYATSTFPIMHPLPTHTHTQILHNLCFSFLLVTTAVPREIENNAYANFFFLGGGGRGIRCIMGNVEVACSPFIFLSLVTVPVPFSLLK